MHPKCPPGLESIPEEFALCEKSTMIASSSGLGEEKVRDEDNDDVDEGETVRRHVPSYTSTASSGRMSPMRVRAPPGLDLMDKSAQEHVLTRNEYISSFDDSTTPLSGPTHPSSSSNAAPAVPVYSRVYSRGHLLLVKFAMQESSSYRKHTAQGSTLGSEEGIVDLLPRLSRRMMRMSNNRIRPRGEVGA